MAILTRIIRYLTFGIFVILVIRPWGANAQTGKLAWADEFNGTEIDRSVWNFGSGTSNDNIHYYTDRAENARIVDGKLRIIALKESYRGLNYTSALLETSGTFGWRYGRVEARIKLPGTPGFVPAFWMLPSDNLYGWWPASGEIDVMEYPTTEGSKIYGTLHTKAYNLFDGAPPRGGSISVPTAESEFHLYAAEWTPDKIDFYVDGTKYYSFANDHKTFSTWPFNRPFYIIVNLAVGGGWVGAPVQATVFPAVMEIDYIRVYQAEADMAVNGPDYLSYNSPSALYFFPAIDGALYSWSLPGHAEILSGANTSRILTRWNLFGGTIHARVQTNEGSRDLGYPVEVSPNLLKNSSFEKGVKYWNGGSAPPASVDFRPDTLEAHQGKSSLRIHVKTPGTNAWDVQVSQRGFFMERGKNYNAGFWAKTDGTSGRLSAAIINSADNTLYSNKTFSVTDSWTRFQLDFKAATTAAVSFNIDLGTTAGIYHLDDFLFTTPELSGANQLSNADFEGSEEGWAFNSFSPARASGSVFDGVYAASIEDGGVNAWDVHLGQSGVSLERGKEYTVSFDAHAEGSRTVSALVGRNSAPWTVYSGDQAVSLTTTPGAYTFSFIMTEPSDPQARFGFDIGASSEDVFFDNVFLSGGKTPSGVAGKPDAVPEAIQLLQNYPNPFNPVTTIKYRLSRPGSITLKIINNAGQEVITLVDGFQAAGEHRRDWTPYGLPSGIYFSRLKAGDFVETKKILLQK